MIIKRKSIKASGEIVIKDWADAGIFSTKFVKLMKHKSIKGKCYHSKVELMLKSIKASDNNCYQRLSWCWRLMLESIFFSQKLLRITFLRFFKNINFQLLWEKTFKEGIPLFSIYNFCEKNIFRRGSPSFNLQLLWDF